MNLRVCDLWSLRCLRGFSIKRFIRLRVQQVSNPLSRHTRPVLDLSMARPCSGSNASRASLSSAKPLLSSSCSAGAGRSWEATTGPSLPELCQCSAAGTAVRTGGVSGTVPLPAPPACPLVAFPHVCVSLGCCQINNRLHLQEEALLLFPSFFLFFSKWVLEVKNSCLIQLLGLYHKLVTCNKLAHLLVCQHSQKQTKWLID